MRFTSTLAVFLAAASTASAFTSPSSQRSPTVLSAASSQDEQLSERRQFLRQTLAAGAMLWLPQTASAGLLDDFGADPSKIVEAKKVEEIIPAGVKKEIAIDPTLRASYYYPTAKKRYLPRIQKVTANINRIPDAIANNDWAAVEEFSATADNAILPLQLYVSSLDGQGLSLSNSYSKTMKDEAKSFEKQYKVLQKAMGKKDKDMALMAVTEMGVSVANYRQAGRLSDDDGNIPSVDDIKRMTMRRPTQQFGSSTPTYLANSDQQ